MASRVAVLTIASVLCMLMLTWLLSPRRNDDAMPTIRAVRMPPQHVRSANPESTHSYDVDPLPGVHMVYMYANGSDPGISLARERFGGPRGGACFCRCLL